MHWILAVLQDLRAYASDNDLRRLEQHLGQAFEIACSELAENDGDTCDEKVEQSDAGAD
ncbi:hypothetical protein [Aquicoccus sp. SU-CL01552]|uniref:hypothetical protein n=1 Tax=Aquicoccus sp. SU-CL01552 TaxID=3127656 RepID=UPI0033406AFE